MSIVIAVEKKFGEKARQQLLAKKALDFTQRIQHDDKNVYLPVLRSEKLSVPFKIVNKKLPKSVQRPSGWNEALAQTKAFTAKQTEQLSFGLDLLGDIAVLEPPSGMSAKQKNALATAVRTLHPHVKVVAAKKGALKGTFRTRSLEFLWGEKRASTIHTESGVRMKIDLGKAYFSPRLVHDREIVANDVKPGEKVLVLFAGVGPYALVIAKRQPRAQIIANELNPYAVKLMQENVAMNHAENVSIHEGDAKLAIEKFAPNSSRIVMPAPWEAEKFLPQVLKAARKGTVVNYRAFVKYPKEGGVTEMLEVAQARIQALAKKLGKKVQILEDRVVMRYSPSIVQTAIDFKIV
ncbi:MAG TPA: methyltransferase [Candidatus Norongarragalinales archaeon]|jgi:tRNA (guanine37-N1)-methyltransferase|nr:methyltransferase [Candidatus Norongarragalinales archaeon]